MRGANQVLFQNSCITGGKLQVMESLIRTCAQICRDDRNVTKMYIGIGSGETVENAMRRRYDEYKASEGINHMVGIYESSSQDNAREIEDSLCDYFASHGRNINRTGGGGGRDSNGPKFFVYLAVRRWG
eukprot:CAMPEP_0174960350 /NCGR_PEP_ID=MMETSP0004_2-20121128/3658_1 /TAXON_ID=420556 /ORGANISM="Ochromonas sp., Strain CCMP1393" /LENGTH=128 /DNA_ID=CAMNT_0016208719 /DNA_START=78 /DNA_END=464 /DNA_ORIENTATION=+